MRPLSTTWRRSWSPVRPPYFTSDHHALHPLVAILAEGVVIVRSRAVATLAVSAWLIPMPALAQANTETLVLAPQEAEAHEMSLTLAAVGCSPRRHNNVEGSESIIERDPEPLVGTAAFYRNFEGTFIVLEEYDEELWGHCLAFGWFGGALEPGRYRIRQLSLGTVEAEVGAEDHSFFSMAAIRNEDENSILVIESGTIEIVTIEPGRITGSFDLSGFLLDGATRTDDIAWRGSFRAHAEA